MRIYETKEIFIYRKVGVYFGVPEYARITREEAKIYQGSQATLRDNTRKNRFKYGGQETYAGEQT